MPAPTIHELARLHEEAMAADSAADGAQGTVYAHSYQKVADDAWQMYLSARVLYDEAQIQVLDTDYDANVIDCVDYTAQHQEGLA